MFRSVYIARKQPWLIITLSKPSSHISHKRVAHSGEEGEEIRDEMSKLLAVTADHTQICSDLQRSAAAAYEITAGGRWVHTHAR